MPYLRLERQAEAGWTLTSGPNRLGHIVPGRIAFEGFPDAEAARAASEAAERVLRDWHEMRRSPTPTQLITAPDISLSEDGKGFCFPLPTWIWHAVALELAQRVHAVTVSLRNPEPEPAA
ncbi:MAG: hypothetical protein MNPFHGCM_02637 [Gemmatimonadaceae bacterium]|nr:hypothetical protein [Gemmatimonadaceae bacterium]